jgi:hypothetical protein
MQRFAEHGILLSKQTKNTMKRFLFPALLLLALLPGCTEEKPDGYMIFGKYHGMCNGPDCVIYAKLENNTLYVNTQDQYPNWTASADGLEFSQYTGQVPDGIFELPGKIPASMYTMSKLIGQPDAYDQGGFYVELMSDNTLYTWKIDTNMDDVPQELHSFCNAMDNYLDQL